MKVLLLGFGKIAYMPYLHFYLDVCKDRDDIDFELIYWARDGNKDADVPARISKAYKFEAHLEEQLPPRKKLKYFLKFRPFVRNVLKHHRYDRIVVLYPSPGLLIMDNLFMRYRGKYILDIRDITHEDVPIYKAMVGQLVKKSAVTYVSSDAFRKFLPRTDKIYTIHNVLEDSLRHRMLRKKQPRERSVLRVSFWGLVRQVNVNLKVIDALGNDPRFELHYYGRMQQEGRDLEQYAKDHRYENVFFHGQYMPNDRYAFAEQTDLIHNFYDLDVTMGNAMPNKYYDGIIFGIPQLCTAGSFMGDVAARRGVGLQVDLDRPDVADALWAYYHTIRWDDFEWNCQKALEQVLQEQETAKKALFRALESQEQGGKTV